ncbi:hypothetical protein [Noviherbaspirillum massiliense]|uniref:hypothetical protein n=1 Tax=Noviherbaspirillum massiliense TaxID=1465823 RepID=UPI0011DD4021|nr:hypothetical protein [Noviherbaspirillum massiliense]
MTEPNRLLRRGRKSREGGFSRFEFGVCTILAGVLAAVFLHYLLRYQEQAEKIAMETTVINMRSGLRLRIAELMTLDRMNEAGTLLQENPVNWLETPPPNYLGEMADSTRADIPAGNWYFDTARRELVYLPRLARYFEADPGAETAIRFRVTAIFSSPSGNGKAQAKAQGIAIVPVHSYIWF